MMLTYDKPADHPRISLKEKEYILSSIGSAQDKKTRVGKRFSVLLSFTVRKYLNAIIRVEIYEFIGKKEDRAILFVHSCVY